MTEQEIADLARHASREMAKVYGRTLALIPSGDKTSATLYTACIAAKLLGELVAIIAGLGPETNNEKAFDAALEAILPNAKSHGLQGMPIVRVAADKANARQAQRK